MDETQDSPFYSYSTTIVLWTSNSNVEEQQNYTLIDQSLSDNELLPSSSDDLSTKDLNNYWALLALVLVLGTAAGNILVCLAITKERRLQNVTNYFLMSLAITDLMVAILVMPLGILTLVKGEFINKIYFTLQMLKFPSLKMFFFYWILLLQQI